MFIRGAEPYIGRLGKMKYLTFTAANATFFPPYEGQVAFPAPEYVIVFIFETWRGFFL